MDLNNRRSGKDATKPRALGLLGHSVDVYTVFKSDLINNMDHMRISGTEPSSVILSQSSLKSWMWCAKIPKQAEAKRDGVINPQIYKSSQF